MNIDKPVEFLGALVSNVELGMGWGAEAGHCNIDLVEDPDNGKLFDPPPLGTACLFKLGRLSFGGVLRRYNYTEDVSSGRRYSVVLESPNSLLTGVYLILARFQGTFYKDDENLDKLWLKEIMTYGGKYPTNVINLYGDKENYEKGGLYGSANLNSSGYPTKGFIGDIAEAVKKGNFGGKIKFSDTEYELDLSEIADVLAKIPDYRFSGEFTDFSTFVSTLCDIANFDYTTTITGKTDARGVVTGDAKIKIKTLSRDAAPQNNILEQIIEDRKGKDLVSFNRGKEYADIVTQKVLLGDYATRYWLADQRYILPVWGKTGFGMNTTYYYGNSIYDYNNPLTSVRVTLDGGYDGGEKWVDTTLLELRCAMGGREAWQAYHILMALKTGTKSFTFGALTININGFAQLLKGDLFPQELADTSMYNAEQYALWMYGPEAAQTTYAQRWINSRFKAVQSAAQTFYGRQFLVAIPGEAGGIPNNLKWIEFDKKYESSWEPTSSAWAGDDAVLDFQDTMFYDDEGRLNSVGVFGNFPNADYSSLGSEYGISRLGTNNGAVVKTTVDIQWGTRWFENIQISEVDKNGNLKRDSRGNVIKTKKTLGFVKVDIGSPIPIHDQWATFDNGFNSLCRLILGEPIYPGNHNLGGFGNLDFPVPPAMLAPEYLGVPQVSTRYVWGPWFAFNDKVGQIGKVEIEEDRDMRPEVFGSIAKMNEFGESTVKADLAGLIESEEGSMELAEMPAFDLAERFYGSGPYVTSMTISASVDGGYKTSYGFSTWTQNFGALSKYNMKMFKDQRLKSYKYQKQINESFLKRPSLPIEKLSKEGFSSTVPRALSSTSLIAGNMYNAMARSLNSDRRLGVGVNGVSTQEAMRMLGLNPMESFAIGQEQMYTPVFTYNQKDPAGMKQRFNKGIWG
jgi:hypothetical protein